MQFGKKSTALLDLPCQIGVLWEMYHPDTGSQNGQRTSTALECSLVGGHVYAASHPADNGVAFSDQLFCQAVGHVVVADCCC